MDIKNLIKDEIRKVIEFEDSSLEIQKIVIKNPTNKVKEKFMSNLEDKEENPYAPIDYLISELTNLELTESIEDFYERDFVAKEFNLVIKEMVSISLEIIDEYLTEIDTKIDLMKIEKRVESLNE